MPPTLRVQITKKPDGGSILRCTRADGSLTWQRQSGPQARFFAAHDLTHYAVETTLGARYGFFGLIADGWDIADTTGKGARGPLPPEALAIEHLVGTLDRERSSGEELTAEALNEYAASFAIDGGRAAPRAVTDAELARMRALVRELHGRWLALPPGASMDLDFDRLAP